jgi:hypothetical protein
MEVPTSQGRKWPRLGHLRLCFQLCVCESPSCSHAIWPGMPQLGWLPNLDLHTGTKLGIGLDIHMHITHTHEGLCETWAQSRYAGHQGSDISECWLDSCWCCSSACRHVLSELSACMQYARNRKCEKSTAAPYHLF